MSCSVVLSCCIKVRNKFIFIIIGTKLLIQKGNEFCSYNFTIILTLKESLNEMSEELFYYNRRKRLIDGLILTIVSLLFQPFYLLFHEGLLGLLISLLPFKFLMRGLIYLIQSFWPLPTVRLTSQGIEFNTVLMIQKKLKWNEIRSIEYIEEEESHRSNPHHGGGGITFRLRFRISDFEKQSIVLKTYEGETYSISMDGIQLEGKDLEQLLLNYKRTYFFDS